MAAGEVVLNGTQLNDGTTTSAATAPNLLDGNALTYWHTDPQSTQGWAGMDAGTPCQLTRIRFSTLGGYEDATFGAEVQFSSTSTFPQILGIQQSRGSFLNLTNQSSINQVFQFAQTSGNANVVFVVQSTGAVVSGVSDTANGAYTQLYAAGANNISAWIFTGIANANAGTNTVTASFSTNSNFPSLFIAEYKGVSGSGTAAMDQHSSASGTSTTPSAGSFTTTTANQVIVAVVSAGGASTIGSGSGFTMNVNFSPTFGSAMEEQPLTATGTFNPGFTLSASNAWFCTALSLKLTGPYDPGIISIIGTRPIAGTLLNEIAVSSQPLKEFYRWNAPVGSNGNLGDLDFIVQYRPGVVAAAVAPTILPTARVFDTPTVFTLASITTDASIYYTLDGTTPTTSSTLYTGPFTISSTSTLKAIAVSPGLTNSRVTSTPVWITSDFNSAQTQWDNRNYKLWAISPFIFHDPIGGYWWMYGWNQDQPGVKTFGFIGINIYKSADLRNWVYVGEMNKPAPGTEFGNLTFAASRPLVAYNALNNNYVMWMATSNGAISSWVSTAPQGVWNFNTQITIVNGQSIQSDFLAFLDDDGTSMYIHGGILGGSNSFVTKLNSSWTAQDGVNFVIYSNNQFGYGGSQPDAPHIFRVGSTYFMTSSALNQWTPTQNRYATASSIFGPWTDQGLFAVKQPGPGNGVPDYTICYGSQNNYTYKHLQPNRNVVYMTCDAFNTGLAGNQGSGQPPVSFQTYTEFFLPVAFPTTGTISVNWNPKWNLSDYQTLSGAPLAPTSFAFSGGAFSWTNNEPNPAMLYLDFVTSTVRSELISYTPFPTSYTPVVPVVTKGGPNAGYYRLRIVNAFGSTTTQPIYIPVNVTSTGLYVVYNAFGAFDVMTLIAGADYRTEITKIEFGPFADWQTAFSAYQAALWAGTLP